LRNYIDRGNPMRLERRGALSSLLLTTVQHVSLRDLLGTIAASLGPLPTFAALSGGDEASLAQQYAAGARASGGRGANTMIKARAESGVRRIGSGSPVFKPGSILAGVRSADGSIIDISFSYPDDWTAAKGPNLDVRDVRTSDSAFVLAAPLPSSIVSVEALPKNFFAGLLFATDGKYGAYGGVDDYSVKDNTVQYVTTPVGLTQPYRRLDLRFSVLSYNANTVQRRASLSATVAGGSVFVLVAGCLGTRYKSSSDELESIAKSFRAIAAAKARALALEQEQSEAAEVAAAEEDDMALSKAREGTVGATTTGRVGYRYER